MSGGLIDIVTNITNHVKSQDSFQDVKYTFNLEDNAAAKRLLTKYNTAVTLFWLYIFAIVVIHILMTAITIKLVPIYKVLHGIMYFLFGLFWLCPVLIYYVLSNDYVLGKVLYPSANTSNGYNTSSGKFRRL